MYTGLFIGLFVMVIGVIMALYQHSKNDTSWTTLNWFCVGWVIAMFGFGILHYTALIYGNN